MGTFVAFLFVFGIVVFFHEAGHFFVSKWAGIKVYEFSIGMGPRLFSKKYKGTLYGLNALPLGGYVRIAGLDDTEKEKAKRAENYNFKSWGVRVAVLVAGPFMNIVLALLIFILSFSIIGVPRDASQSIKNVLPGSPAAVAGWQAEDVIVSFNGRPVKSMKDVIAAIHRSKNSTLYFVLDRKGKKITSALVPQYYPKENISLIGINLKPLQYQRFSPVKAMYSGVTQTLWLTKEIVFGMAQIFTGKVDLKNISGPLGIAQMSGDAAAQGWVVFLNFIAILSINLGVLNILPLPALDGGRVLFLLIERITGSRISIEKERVIHYLGFSFLLLLLVLITFQDLRRIFNF